MTDELVERLLDWPYQGETMAHEAADRIETLNQEVEDLKKLVFAAYCEGFQDGKSGGWIVGPSNQPWKASDTHKALIRMESRDV